MAYQVFSCNALTGAIRDVLPVESHSWERRLSASSAGAVSVKLDGTLSKTALRTLTDYWASLIVIVWEREIQYMGFVKQRDYMKGRESIDLRLTDIWGLWERRGAWDHHEPFMEKWKTTVNGPLATQAAQAVLRGRSGPVAPSMSLPITVPGFSGTSVSRTYYGYHLELVDDVLAKLMDEGLDVYFKPRFIANGDADWLMQAGPAWGSGVTREFFVDAPLSAVVGFRERGDASRVTNNARRVGEGSEEDMLVRSNRNTASPYPLLDRVTQAKTTNNVAQLAAMANNDLALYAHPTVQWDADIHIGQGVDVGDTGLLHFSGDPWIADGRHERRVVKVSGGSGSDLVTVAFQPTGGL